MAGFIFQMPVRKPRQGPGIRLVLPYRGKVALATGARADKVYRPELARPVWPPVNHRRRQPVAVTDNEILTSLRREKLKVEGKLSHRHPGLEGFNDTVSVITSSQPQIPGRQRVCYGRITANNIQRYKPAPHVDLPDNIA